jgi:hypothetical protein
MHAHTRPSGSGYSAGISGAANVAVRFRTSKSTIKSSEANVAAIPKPISLRSVQVVTEDDIAAEI